MDPVSVTVVTRPLVTGTTSSALRCFLAAVLAAFFFCDLDGVVDLIMAEFIWLGSAGLGSAGLQAAGSN